MLRSGVIPDAIQKDPDARGDEACCLSRQRPVGWSRFIAACHQPRKNSWGSACSIGRGADPAFRHLTHLICLPWHYSVAVSRSRQLSTHSGPAQPRHDFARRDAVLCLEGSPTSHVLRASAPADVMCWQCVWFTSPVAGWPAGFLNIRARLGAEPVLSRTGSPDGAQPALAAPYAGAAVAPPGRGGKAVKNPGSSSVPAAAAPGGARRTAAANTVFGSRREREGR